MKFKYLAIAAACAALSGPTLALTVAATKTAQVVFHLSGSTALQKVIANSLTNNCSSGSLTTFVGLLNTPAASTTDNANGQSQTIYSCTISTTAYDGNGQSYNGKTLAVYYSTAGGSAFGVFPVAANSAISFADINSCTDSGGTCNNVVNATPDAGVSDLEPVAFNSGVNHPVDSSGNQLFSGATVSSSQFAKSYPVAVQTFGLIVNSKLFAALQADQSLTGSAVPSVSSSAFATIYAPGYSTNFAPAPSDWTPLFTNGGGTPSNQVNICSRLPGSGTRASAQALFLQLPFSALQQPFASPGVDNTGNAIDRNDAGTYMIAEYDNSSALLNCVTGATANGGYAIGLISADRDLSTSDAKFVYLDNQNPNTSVAKFGKYPWVYEAYYNINAHAVDSQFANAFGNNFKTPANINGLTTASKNGIMAAVANCPTPYTGVNAVCSHVTRNGDYRGILQYAQ